MPGSSCQGRPFDGFCFVGGWGRGVYLNPISMDLIPHAGRIAGELDINHWNSSLCERKDAFLPFFFEVVLHGLILWRGEKNHHLGVSCNLNLNISTRFCQEDSFTLQANFPTSPLMMGSSWFCHLKQIPFPLPSPLGLSTVSLAEHERTDKFVVQCRYIHVFSNKTEDRGVSCINDMA